MGYSGILAKIKNTIEGVAGIGKVHDYARWSNQWGDFLTLMKTTGGIIHGYMIQRIAAPSRQVTMGEKEVAHVFQVVGLYGLQDSAASEKTFQGVLDLIVAAFDSNDNLSGECDTIYPDWGPMADAAGCQISLFENRMFGSVLCHYADLRLCAIERKTH